MARMPTLNFFAMSALLIPSAVRLANLYDVAVGRFCFAVCLTAVVIS